MAADPMRPKRQYRKRKRRNPLLQWLRQVFALMPDAFKDRGVEAGTHTKATSPDGKLTIYIENRYGLQNGDFDGHLILAVIANADDLTAHQLHRQWMLSNPAYAARYRETQLKVRRAEK